MVEPPAEKPAISPKLAQTFFDGIQEYVRWAYGHPEQPLPLDRYIQLSLIGGRVDGFTDPLPDDVFSALYVLAIDDVHSNLKEQLSADPTYATASRCFLELIEAKKERIRTIERDRE